MEHSAEECWRVSHRYVPPHKHLSLSEVQRRVSDSSRYNSFRKQADAHIDRRPIPKSHRHCARSGPSFSVPLRTTDIVGLPNAPLGGVTYGTNNDRWRCRHPCAPHAYLSRIRNGVSRLSCISNPLCPICKLLPSSRVSPADDRQPFADRWAQLDAAPRPQRGYRRYRGLR